MAATPRSPGQWQRASPSSTPAACKAASASTDQSPSPTGADISRAVSRRSTSAAGKAVLRPQGTSSTGGPGCCSTRRQVSRRPPSASLRVGSRDSRGDGSHPFLRREFESLDRFNVEEPAHADRAHRGGARRTSSRSPRIVSVADAEAPFGLVAARARMRSSRRQSRHPLHALVVRSRRMTF